ncbi:ABC transporter ATP-binding protein [Paenibacillus sp. MER TA 81-3]|uniref:ATP-binding cassette domain-containing protein n=1 Tax=Paenibacillus sp. MER TA 81-3 TaxID=2939573 RepID=UPI0020412225|nr:ABC transporter ATP-binding protein [Paenibacillus sp. MER TA 81-3]MCM3339588.1 ABC transporter ATP-binding protein [Paenibacillus sp. MER TA 81-3]
MKAEHITFTYKKAKRVLFEDVSFRLHPDKINVLVGPNGAGKTTLFDCISGILRPQAGNMVFPRMDDILYVTQSVFFSPELKGKDFLKFIKRIGNQPASSQPLDYMKSEDEREKELLLKLWDLKIGKMSVGERKWLFIMMLTQIERELYLLDEPTSGVDPTSRKRIFNLVNHLVARKKIVVISTHQLNELLHLDCHMILLHKGKIRYEGNIDKWLEMHDTDDPDHAFDLATSL